jgi:fatty acid desaturase
VWVDIACGYMALIGTCAALIYLDGRGGLPWSLLWALLGAVSIGYWIAFIQLFFHEAAHYNLAPGRVRNDRLANLFVGLMVGQDIKAYRRVHFHHHRYLGTPQDTERSYFDSLDLRFVVHGLLGVKMLAVLGRRSAHLQSNLTAEATRDGLGDNATEASSSHRQRLMLVAGAVLNAGVVLVAALTGHWIVAVAWPLGMASVHPFINATRQLLEHRRFDARSDVDYATNVHGAETRMFRVGPLASTLGGAGFNRHMLHHWEPQISYTRFGELERFLLDTQHADVFRHQTASYRQAFCRLLRAS